MVLVGSGSGVGPSSADKSAVDLRQTGYLAEISDQGIYNFLFQNNI